MLLREGWEASLGNHKGLQFDKENFLYYFWGPALRVNNNNDDTAADGNNNDINECFIN